MSYWYERISKKHILVFLLGVPLAIFLNFGQIAGSYAVGCVPTASRTLYDWVSPERAFNSFEVYPFVYMALDSGCIEWLGFSTCEAVQFQDWMNICTSSELITVHLFNATVTEKEGLSTFQADQISPLVLTRVLTDSGSSASETQLSLKQRVTHTFDFDQSILDQVVVTHHPSLLSGSSSNPWRTVSVGMLLGERSSNVVYLDIDSVQEKHETLLLPTTPNKQMRRNSVYYVVSSNMDHLKCAFDDDCGAQCTWNESCEPQSYGYHGLMLPSATLLFDWKGLFVLGQWPVPGWTYTMNCPSNSDTSCLRENPQIITFSSETFLRETFGNTGTTTSEKFPDVEFQLWRAVGYVRRVENCGGFWRGSPGKDCDVPPQYVSNGQDLFVSFPRPSGQEEPLLSEIYSEKVTGLRFDFLDVWQMNSRLMQQQPNGEKDYSFLPLFWMQRQPLALKINEDLQFSMLKEYGSYIFTFVMLGFTVYVLSWAAMLVVVFYGISCIAYIQDLTATFKQNEPDWY